MENASQAATRPDTSSGDGAASQGGGNGKDLTGSDLGDFRLLRRLGQGGMGQVYLAEQISLRRKVALKLLRHELAANETALARFKSEALAVAKATHANIVQVYAIGDDDGRHFMALEYVEGRNLREHLEKKGPPDVLISISIIRQVAAALQRASELGIIHRDVKPENILLTRKGEVKVADFGLSRMLAGDDQPLHLTQSGVTMGTPLYMSPEQVEGKTLDPRTDIYSLGVTAYHMLAGHPPFRGSTAFEVAVQHVQKQATPLQEIRPDIPPELCAVVHKMMAKPIEQRYQTAQEITRDLAQMRDVLVGVSSTMPRVELFTGPTVIPSNGVSATGGSISATQPLPSEQRRSWIPWAGAVAVVVMLFAGMGVGWLVTRGNQTNAAEQQSVEETPDPLFKEEQFLRKTFDRQKAPNDFESRKRGMDAAMDLGVFYLKHVQLEKAQKFFKELEDQRDFSQYKVLGKLGRGMVLAFQDEPEESNTLFRESLKRMLQATRRPGAKRPAFAKRPLNLAKMPFFTHRGFREMLAKALKRNFDNNKAKFPEELRRFISPPAPVVRPTRGDTPQRDRRRDQ